VYGSRGAGKEHHAAKVFYSLISPFIHHRHEGAAHILKCHFTNKLGITAQNQGKRSIFAIHM